MWPYTLAEAANGAVRVIPHSLVACLIAHMNLSARLARENVGEKMLIFAVATAGVSLLQCCGQVNRASVHWSHAVIHSDEKSKARLRRTQLLKSQSVKSLSHSDCSQRYPSLKLKDACLNLNLRLEALSVWHGNELVVATRQPPPGQIFFAICATDDDVAN